MDSVIGRLNGFRRDFDNSVYLPADENYGFAGRKSVSRFGVIDPSDPAMGFERPFKILDASGAFLFYLSQGIDH